MTLDLSRQPGDEMGTLSGLKWTPDTVAPGYVDSVYQVFHQIQVSGALGTLGLEEGQATPEPFPQELHVGRCGRVLKGRREAEDIIILHVFRLHGGDVQEVVGVDVVDHCAVGQADQHLHRKAVLLQVQACQLPVEGVPLLDLQVLQLLHQGPGTDEALVEESEYGRAFQDSLPESPPGTSAGLVVQGPPQQDGMDEFVLGLGSVKGLRERQVVDLLEGVHGHL